MIMNKIKLEIIYRFKNHPELEEQLMILNTYVNDNNFIYKNIYKNNQYYNKEYELLFKPIINSHFNELTEIILINIIS